MNKDLESRIKVLENRLDIISNQLNKALKYIEDDPHSSLTKSRTILEQVLLNIYKLEMNDEPKRLELGAILTDNQFTRKIDRRIVSRMNSIRDMSNLGVHGDKVFSKDAKIVLDNLCEVLEWYFENYNSGTSVKETDEGDKLSGNRVFRRYRKLIIVLFVSVIVVLVLSVIIFNTLEKVKSKSTLINQNNSQTSQNQTQGSKVLENNQVENDRQIENNSSNKPNTTITITSDLKIFLETTRINFDQLESKLVEKLNGIQNPIISLIADKRVDSEIVDSVLAVARKYNYYVLYSYVEPNNKKNSSPSKNEDGKGGTDTLASRRIENEKIRADEIAARTKRVLNNNEIGKNAFTNNIDGKSNNKNDNSGFHDTMTVRIGNGISYILIGRKGVELPAPKNDFKKEGKIVVEISVDRSGLVVQAIPGIKGTNTLDEYLLSISKDAALRSKFEQKPDAPVVQKGTITYNLVSR